MTQLTLFLDGMPATDDALPTLARLLARADALAPLTDTRPFASLLHSFGLSPAPDVDLPLAALTRLGTHGEATGLWLYAAPVHQQADQDKVYLIGRAQLSAEENAEALRTLNQLFAEDGWTFHPHDDGDWLLHLPAGKPPQTTPLEQAMGMAIGPYLPQPRDATPWPRALTEMQMLLHGCAFNREREGQGMPMVNGVWLWGAGSLPSAVALPWQGVWGAGALVQGLATLQQRSSCPAPVDYPAWQQQAEEGDHWLRLFLPEGKALEQAWFAPLAQALRRGELSGLHIHAANGRRWYIESRQRRRWWRRRMDLSEALQ